MPRPADSPSQAPRSSAPALFAGVIALALILRLPGLFLSLWYDELYTLLHFVAAPLSSVVAGEYSPNNHVLFTLLAKLLAAFGDPALAPQLTRLPSLAAGVGAAILLAAPLRRTHPLLALLPLLMMTLHPWAVVISNWVRGYSLMLCLALAATCLLGSRRLGWVYVLTVAAAIYTLPVALLLLPAHAAVLLLPSHRGLRRKWLLAAAAALLAAALLYLPFVAGARGYWEAAHSRAPLPYGEFLYSSFAHAAAGHAHIGFPWLLLPLGVCIAGGLLAWRAWPALRPMLLTFAVVSLLGILVPLLFPPLGEARAMVWLIPLFCLGAAGLLARLLCLPAGRFFSALATLALAATLFRFDFALWETPAQPIGNAVTVARQLAGPSGAVVGIYMAAPEASATYGQISAIAMNEPQLVNIEARAAGPLIAVVFYEEQLKRDQLPLWQHLQRDYDILQRLDGLIAPAIIYRHR